MFRGVQAQRLDVPQQGDLPLQRALLPAELDGVRQEVREQPISAPLPLRVAGRGVDPPERQGKDLHALVSPDLGLALVVQQDDLRGRELTDQVLGTTGVDQAAGGADPIRVLDEGLQPASQPAHVSAAGAETVLGVFLQLGAHDAALDPILNAALTHLDKTPAGTSTPGSNVGTIDFAGLLPSSMMGRYFEGSLTTPPRSQVVNWLVFSTPIAMDAQQLAEYQLVANDDGFLPNARTVQPVDGRQLIEIDFDLDIAGALDACVA